MKLAIVHTRAQLGLKTPTVTVEVHVSSGLPSITIVGLPETSVRESKERVRSALINSHFEFPIGRITINLAPAELPKEGGSFDLAIALGILTATGQLPDEAVEGFEFLGELALSGVLRPVRACLPATIACKDAKRTLILPVSNAHEAQLVPGASTLYAENLLQVCAHLRGTELLCTAAPEQRTTPTKVFADLKDVAGQEGGKRALEIAASGGHNLLFCGPPGSGKTMLATRMPGILPGLEINQCLQVATIESVMGKLSQTTLDSMPPFRSPHHSATAPALVGGGNPPRPGEITRAHHGVLFLDELPEFSRHTLEVLREPIESGEITIARSGRSECFPARFQLLAAMNPCPCGYYGDSRRNCQCGPEQIRRYRARLSGPLLDRIDLHLQLDRPSSTDLFSTSIDSEPSATVRHRVLNCQKRQHTRQGALNAIADNDRISNALKLHYRARDLLVDAVDRHALSARAAQRVIRVARTIADVEGAGGIKEPHLLEAISYRALERDQVARE